MQPTVVTFPQGEVTGEATVVRLVPHDEGAVVVLDATPFHPVDHTWPDQPGDSGSLCRIGGAPATGGARHAAGGPTEAARVTGGQPVGVAGETVRVVEAVMAAADAEGRLFVGTDIPVKRGAEGWTWLVGHVLDGPVPGWLTAGARVVAEVDAVRRAALSRGHTACHLSSLALDAALADLWRKDPGVDPLGNPDFEGRAGQSSSIRFDGSVDGYRLGKSLRKAGFDADGLAATLGEHQDRVNAQLAEWVATGAPSSVVAEGSTIADRRRWECDLPEGRVGFLCGGTHAASLSEFASITVDLDLSDPQLLVMTTTAQSK